MRRFSMTPILDVPLKQTKDADSKFDHEKGIFLMYIIIGFVIRLAGPILSLHSNAIGRRRDLI